MDGLAFANPEDLKISVERGNADFRVSCCFLTDSAGVSLIRCFIDKTAVKVPLDIASAG
jgi:hypothetical protein